MFQKFKTKVFNFAVRIIKTALIEVELEKTKVTEVELEKIKIIEENKYSQENLSKDLQNSEQEGENIKDWWERAHIKQHKGWLTGSMGQEVWKNLEITDKLKVGANVLNIGVGMGHCTRELAKLGLNSLHALDISRKALDSVKDIAVCWTPDKLSAMPSNFFDVAISNLVAQHMSDKDLIPQIREVCRALKPDGVFAIQMAQNIDNKHKIDQSVKTQKTGGVLRTNKEITKIIKSAGGKIIRQWEGPNFPEYNSRWTFVHIGKNIH